MGECSASQKERLFQPLALTYRQIEDKFYVADPYNRQVVILNPSAFHILSLCHGVTISELMMKIENARAFGQPLSDREVVDFVTALCETGLLTKGQTTPRH